MKVKTEKFDFDFCPAGHGFYTITYRSPVTGKEWRAKVAVSPLTDAVIYEDDPRRCDLDDLKRLVKQNSQYWPLDHPWR